MKQLNIDIETYSEADLGSCGVYKYVDHPSFEILLLGVSVDKGPPVTYDLASGEQVPREIIEGLKSSGVLKFAFNAQFERVCLGKWLGEKLAPDSWRCTMVSSLYLGLPGSLAGVGSVLGLEKKKLDTGKELIKLFSCPVKPTKANGMKSRIKGSDEPEKWELFKQYNMRDVETELEIAERVSRFPVPDFVWKEYVRDQEINDRGIEIDMVLARQAILCDETSRTNYLSRAQKLTGLDNPNSPIQLKEYLQEQGIEVESMAKAEVSKLMEVATGDALEVLELRQLLSKSSIKKYTAMENCCCSDGRAHGLFQFYGASRTGRYASRLIQVQNLRRNMLLDLETARNLVKAGCFDTIEFLYEGGIPDTLSQLIRTAFVPKKGCKYCVADYSAIEARLLAWLANEHWRMEAFRNYEDIYCSSASKMFGVAVEKHGVNSHLRQRGKCAELGLGYSGGTMALINIGALDMGLQEDELQEIVDAWRQSNPAIVKLWYDLEAAAIKAVKEKVLVQHKCVSFFVARGILFMKLPSGRCLSYPKPRIEQNRFGKDAITFEGVGTNKQWQRMETYSGRLTENCIQAIARDVLTSAIERLSADGYEIVMHIHDECVIEAPMDTDINEICRLMSITPEWAPGLLLNATGYECPFYQKD